MQEDEEGFLYPVVDESKCSHCGLCNRVCLMENNPTGGMYPLKVFAARSCDEVIRKESSSGGVFTSLAEYVIDKGGVVFGASFNKYWEVEHDFTCNKEDLKRFRGSKYVQSYINESYVKVKNFLDKGVLVLFSGTPCQCFGLRQFLRKDYDNLILVDFICHGVPSPGVWRWYLLEELKKIERLSKWRNTPICKIPGREDFIRLLDELPTIKHISFRDKRKGWKRFSLAFQIGTPKTKCVSHTVDRSVWMRGFLNNLFLRPSCYQCMFRGVASGSDITIGDFWGIHSLFADMDDNRGTSAVTINSSKGESLYQSLTLNSRECDLECLLERNPTLLSVAKRTAKRDVFFRRSNESFHERIERLCKITIKRRIKMAAKSTIRSLVSERIVLYAKNFLHY